MRVVLGATPRTLPAQANPRLFRNELRAERSWQHLSGTQGAQRRRPMRCHDPMKMVRVQQATATRRE